MSQANQFLRIREEQPWFSRSGIPWIEILLGFHDFFQRPWMYHCLSSLEAWVYEFAVRYSARLSFVLRPNDGFPIV